MNRQEAGRVLELFDELLKTQEARQELHVHEPRQPMYVDGIEHWLQYEERLTAYQEAQKSADMREEAIAFLDQKLGDIEQELISLLPRGVWFKYKHVGIRSHSNELGNFINVINWELLMEMNLGTSST